MCETGSRQTNNDNKDVEQRFSFPIVPAEKWYNLYFAWIALVEEQHTSEFSMAGPTFFSIFYIFPNVPGYISHPLHRPIDIHRYSCQETNPAQMALLKIAFCWPRLSARLQIDDNSNFQMNEQIRAAFLSFSAFIWINDGAWEKRKHCKPLETKCFLNTGSCKHEKGNLMKLKP